MEECVFFSLWIFFDEIYTLSEKNCTCYDTEAINCITQNIENYRSKVFCIFAGNPPEYNKSVKLFDAVTRDRLRIINVVPDAEAWLAYADRRNLNSTVVSYISYNNDKIL